MYYDMEAIKMGLGTTPYDLSQEEMVDVMAWFEDSNYQTVAVAEEMISDIAENLMEQSKDWDNPMWALAYRLAADILDAFGHSENVQNALDMMVDTDR